MPQLASGGTEGVVLNGIRGGDTSGASVRGTGDVNGDGLDDFVIGAWQADPSGLSSGESYLVFGRAHGFPGTFELSSLLPENGGDGSEGVVLTGQNANDWSGNAVSGAGDVNGDGVADLIIGAPGEDPGGRATAGVSYVLFGRTTGFPATIALDSLRPEQGGDGSTGFVLEGVRRDDR